MKRFKLIGARTIVSHGGSLVIPLPHKALELLDKKEGDRLGIIIDTLYKNIIIKRPEDINISATGLSEDPSLDFVLPNNLEEKKDE